MAIKPLTPAEVVKNKGNILPEFVIDSINTLVTMKFNGVNAKFTVEEIIQMIMSKSPVPVTRSEILDNGWLDFEPLYDTYGWDVQYDRPSYNESYAANFTFWKK
jgi:hypothetical protein